MVYFFVLTLGTNYSVFMHLLLKVKDTFHEERDEVNLVTSVLEMTFRDAQSALARTGVR